MASMGTGTKDKRQRQRNQQRLKQLEQKEKRETVNDNPLVDSAENGEICGNASTGDNTTRGRPV